MRARGCARAAASRAAILVVVAGMMVPMAPVAARAQTQYEQLQQQIQDTRAKIHAAQRRESTLMAALSSSDRRRVELEATIGRLTDQLAAAGTKMQALDGQMGVLNAQLNLATEDLQYALANLAEQQSQIERHAAALYIHGADETAGVVLGATDFHTLVAGLVYSERLMDTQLGALKAIETAKAEVEARRADVANQQAAVRQQQDLLAKQARTTNALRQQQANARTQVLAEINYRQQLLSRVRSQKEAYIEALQSELAQSQSIEDMLRGAQSGEVIAGAGHGYVVWPVTGVITCPFGWRIHPIYGYRSFHTGIDIGASEGAPVIAARSGEVLSVGYMNAYGLVVIIDHGNRIATVYAHLSRAYVRAGQWVSTRQLIAAVGTTGWSTGPHLHFEVRVDGAPVNPLLYL